MDTLAELLEDELKDIYNAENQLAKALPRLAKKATLPLLKQAFTDHLTETEGQIKRLDEISGLLGIKLKGKVCKAMQGLVEEGKEAIGEKGDPGVIDALLIGAAQRAEHYEIAAYGTVIALAKQLREKEVAGLLTATLAEEKATDVKLTKIALEILKTAPLEEEDDEDEDGDL